MAFTLNPFKRLAGKARKKVNNAVVDKAVDTVVNKHMTPEEITAQILKMNVAKVDRAEFLNKELKGHYPEETVQTAIESVRRKRCPGYHLPQACPAAMPWLRQYLQR